ncbi:MAG: purine-binding chemotaxis protein CheW [Candidatus Omnitrophica bacterium]|nr:purine-binding chemotaxis protein CheW [Candidatus Omnitrophota bacterium]
MLQQKKTEKKEEREILVFNLQDEQMGLDISCVREVLRPQEIHPLVHAPDFIEGVIYVRKFVLAVISLRKRFHIEPLKNASKARIIICKVNNMIVGLIVDSVVEVLRVPVRNIQAPPEILSVQKKGSYMSGLAKVDQRVITLLDLGKILTPEELAHLSGIKS